MHVALRGAPKRCFAGGYVNITIGIFTAKQKPAICAFAGVENASITNSFRGTTLDYTRQKNSLDVAE